MEQIAEYQKRRQAVFNQMEKSSALVLWSGEERKRSNDTHYRFRVDSDFVYLTGFTEPEAWLYLEKNASGATRTVLFCRPRDPEKEQWDGRRLGAEAAPHALGIEAAFTLEHLATQMAAVLVDVEQLYYQKFRYPKVDTTVSEWTRALQGKIRSGVVPLSLFASSDVLIHPLRQIKTAFEIEKMAKAASISAQGHCAAMRRCRPDLFEYQLEAQLLNVFVDQGSFSPAYNTIVAGGANACILHYIDNQERLRAGDLVLIDAGAELDYYAGDITRTFPVSGKFSAEQVALYSIVLEAQQQAIDCVKPGATFMDPHEVTLKVLVQGLIDLGWLKGEVTSLIEQQAYRPFYMHRTSHWLGIDVHDVGAYKEDGKWIALRPGMVMTIEPGLYVSADNQNVPEAFRGIGIRIEDDVAVTENGHHVLTAAVPKSIVEIEALMAAST